jgi:hypothetical protein
MKNRLLPIFLLILLAMTAPSVAQEPVPCDSCAGYPEGSYMRSGGPELGGTVYRLSCQSGTWEDLDQDAGGDPCASCSHPLGAECADGSFYIGLSPEDGERVYMTDATLEGSGIRWDSASCSYCGNGSVATSQTDGRANTNALLAFNATGFDAAAHCESLNAIEAHGYDDWYLPAGGPNGSSSEINLIWLMVQAEGAVGGLNTSGSRYWSSSDFSSTSARLQRFSDGQQSTNSKSLTLLVRCVRR